MFGIGTSELIVIGIVILLLFGAKSLPEIARSIAQGIRIFKKELNSSPDSEGDSKQKSEDKK
ncbi:MAG: twin-arginine translocase TatA/TatE family subunit [Candidatus Aureabacteria bacterium]|nr:twin-arginine translocase TatA/TatE family subunit [Candidatus Auribacterota bacterium]